MRMAMLRAVGGRGRQDPSTDRNGVHKAEDRGIRLRHMPSNGEAHLPSVAVHGPNGDAEERGGA